MPTFRTLIKPYVDVELEASDRADQRRDAQGSFRHLERAHVLGQTSTVEHVRVHWRMFLWGWQRRDLRECLGQVLRIFGAGTKTALGWVPPGNTGGSNVSPFRRLPLDPELAAEIARARRLGSRSRAARLLIHCGRLAKRPIVPLGTNEEGGP
jgi:hypothetical protein